MTDIRPIRDVTDYEQALAEIDVLNKQNPDGNTLDADRLELLSILVVTMNQSTTPSNPPMVR